MDDEKLCHVIKEISGVLRGRTLDVGCDSGELEECLLSQDVIQGELLGIDKWEYSLDYAQKKLQRYNVAVRCLKMNAERLEFSDGAFDNYLSIRVFHEIDEPTRALKESYRILRLGGLCLIIDWKKGAETGVPERYYSLEEATTLIRRSTNFKITNALIRDDYIFVKCIK